MRKPVMHDLAGAAMLPGLVDAHSHFPASGMALFLADLGSPPVGQVTEHSRSYLSGSPARSRTQQRASGSAAMATTS